MDTEKVLILTEAFIRENIEREKNMATENISGKTVRDTKAMMKKETEQDTVNILGLPEKI